MTTAAKQQELQERLEDLDNFIDEQTEAITEYSEALVRRLIEKITVYDEKLVVEFKSGLQIEVEAQSKQARQSEMIRLSFLPCFDEMFIFLWYNKLN